MGHQVRVLDDLSSGRIGNLQRQADLVVANVCDPDAVMRAKRMRRHFPSRRSYIVAHQRIASALIVSIKAPQSQYSTPRAFAGICRSCSPRRLRFMGNMSGDGAPSPAPRSAYGADKAGSDCICRPAGGASASRAPRCGSSMYSVLEGSRFALFGRDLRILVRALARLPLIIHGDGLQSRDFIFVEDVVRFLSPAMDRLHQRPAHFACNVCTGKATTIRRLAEMVAISCRQPSQNRSRCNWYRRHPSLPRRFAPRCALAGGQRRDRSGCGALRNNAMDKGTLVARSIMKHANSNYERPEGVRICVTGLRGIPGVMGGVEVHCEQLFPRLKALRPDYEIWLSADDLMSGAARLTSTA